VTVLVPNVIVMLVLVLVVDGVVGAVEAEVTVEGAVVVVAGVVVVVAVVVVVGVVDDGVVVVVVTGVGEVLGTGVNGLVVGPEPPKNTKTTSTKSSTTSAPNNTNAHGERYHGRAGLSGGPGGCWPYGAYSLGCCP
jgi:hypothetical protein